MRKKWPEEKIIEILREAEKTGNLSEMKTQGCSERRSCMALGVDRSSMRYERREPDAMEAYLVKLMTYWAMKQKRYGYRRVERRLRAEGHVVKDPANIGSNLYEYCSNNPVNSTDPTGLYRVLSVNGINNGRGDYQGFFQNVRHIFKGVDEDNNTFSTYGYTWYPTAYRPDSFWPTDYYFADTYGWRGLFPGAFPVQEVPNLLPGAQSVFSQHLYQQFVSGNTWSHLNISQLVGPGEGHTFHNQETHGANLFSAKNQAFGDAVFVGHSNGCRILTDFMRRLKASHHQEMLPKKFLMLSPAMTKVEIEALATEFRAAGIKIMVVTGGLSLYDGSELAFPDRVLARGTNVKGIVVTGKDVSHHNIGVNSEIWQDSMLFWGTRAQRDSSTIRKYYLYSNGVLLDSNVWPFEVNIPLVWQVRRWLNGLPFSFSR